MALRRRIFLAGGVGALGAGALGYGGSLAVCALTQDRLALLRPLYVALDGLRGAAPIGVAWQKVETPAVAADHLLHDTEVVAALLMPDPAVRKNAIEQVMRRDFSAGSVVLVDRWLVAESEARIAALRIADSA